tara:strand:- start:3888 stop:5060 length:1173 start_codon:yes stop_codon:yes gene_type:complete
MSIFKGLLQDDEFLIAAGLLQQGAQGKSVGEGLFNSIAQAGQYKKLLGGNKNFMTVFNKTTGEVQFATSNQIQNSSGNLIPYTKPQKPKDQFKMLTNEEAQAEGFDTSNNQKYQKNVTTNKILPFNAKIDKSTTINMTGNKQESKFSETVGAGQGEVFNNIIKAGENAQNENIDLDILTQTAENLETGKAAPLISDLMKWGQSFNIDMKWLGDMGSASDQIANTEVISVLAGNQLFGKISQTKGAISEKEMDIFESLTTSMSMSPQGLKNNAIIMTAINDREILKSQMAESWVAGQDGKLNSLLTRQKVTTANGEIKNLTFNEMFNDYVEAKDKDGNLINPLIPKEQLEEMVNLSNANESQMENNPNFIKTKNGWYYIVDKDQEIYKKLK